MSTGFLFMSIHEEFPIPNVYAIQLSFQLVWILNIPEFDERISPPRVNHLRKINFPDFLPSVENYKSDRVIE